MSVAFDMHRAVILMKAFAARGCADAVGSTLEQAAMFPAREVEKPGKGVGQPVCEPSEG
jgi:hypothetical protein